MAPVLKWLLRNSHDPSANSTAAITLNTTRACVRPMMTNICEEHKGARLSSPVAVDTSLTVQKKPQKSENATHHGGDADQHQRAAQVGVLVLFRLAVDIVDNL